MNQIETLLAEMVQLQRQALGLAGGSPLQDPLTGTPIRRAVAKEQTAQNFYSTGGLFVDCDLERPVMNTTIQPVGALANMIPVRPTTDETIKFAFVTAISDAGTTPMDYPCDDPPQVGDVSACYATFGIGRLEYSTKTIELDELIRKANRGVHEDLYFVGDVRGVPIIPTRADLSDPNLVTRSAVRRQIMLWGRSTQLQLLNWFWNGDPTSVAQNGTHGGWKSFYGLDSMIDDDYGTKTYVTGTNCAALNSDVKDFAVEPGGGLVGTDNLYKYLQELEDTIYLRALDMRLVPFTAKIVMHPITWGQVVKYLPCDMASDSCGGTNVVVNANDGGTGLFNLAMRRQLESTMRLELNGRPYDVVLDGGVPITRIAPVSPATVPTYKAAIYFVTTEAAGEQTLYWRTMDYSQFTPMLAPIPYMPEMEGWSDGGRYHWVIDRDHGRCFNIRGKIEPALVFTAPHLSGRINNVTVAPLQDKPLPTTTP